MASMYRIYGVEMSPYSVKVRSYFRYKGIAHRWIVRNAETDGGLPEIREAADRAAGRDPRRHGHPGLDADHRAASRRCIPSRRFIQPDAIAAFISALLEEFGDEWGNKWMFHYRWAREVDQLSSAGPPGACDDAGRGRRAAAARWRR